MFKIRKRAIVANTDADLRILEGNVANAGSSPDFNGFASLTSFFQIVPEFAEIQQGQLVKVRKTHVKANNTSYGGTSPNYSAVTLGTPFTNFKGETVTPESVDVRRASGQTGTLTINSLDDKTTGLALKAGQKYRIRIFYRMIDRNQIDMQMGWKNVGTNDVLTASALTSTTTLASRITAKFNELAKANPELQVTATSALGVITFVGATTGLEFYVVVSDTVDPLYADIDGTWAVTIPQFLGVNDTRWIRTHLQTREGMWDLNNGTTRFLPIDGAYYDSYFITYRVTREDTSEHQAGTINAEQSHLMEIQLYVNQSATATIAKLDLLLA